MDVTSSSSHLQLALVVPQALQAPQAQQASQAQQAQQAPLTPPASALAPTPQ